MSGQNKKEKQKKNIYSAMEDQILSFWEKSKTFEKSVEKEAPNGDYVFYDGPPFATGTPHYGHIVASVMKDAVPRYWTMKGYRVERKWGWDCHGLPVENLAEKELELKDKTDIEKMGVEKFNDYCQSIVLRYALEWKKIIKRMGRWVDMETDYKTMDADYMESIWWVFKSLWEKDLIYKGHKAMHICPRCGTTLSNFEVTQGYKDIKDLSCIAKFELVDEPGTFILAWTTTPWTLIGNVALAVGEKIDYVLVEIEKEKFILAKEKIEEVFKDKQYNIIKELKGKDLVNKEYKPLFDYYANDEKLENRENGWKVYASDFVSTEEGVGIVHIAPGFGEDDMNMGREYKLPFVQHVDSNGRFKDEVKDFAGLEVKPKDNHQKTDIEIIKYLAHNNLLFHKEKYEHSYPHCWRCDTPLLNYATESWFVEVTKIKDDLIKNNKEVHWVPGHIKDGRFGKWLEQAKDWAISRNRYWGAPLPVWICESCNEQKVIGSRKELEMHSDESVQDLHKQFVDKIEIKCKCGGVMKRIPEVLDCWFESGSMPYAQDHYPFENKEKFEKGFPANFIAEGVDQTRGWFYTLHVLATALKINNKNTTSFQNVIVNGIVLAEDGQKMAKRLSNYPDPAELFERHSADAMRYYLLSSSVLLAENLNFSEEGVKLVLQKVEMLLLNVYKFYEMFSEDFEISEKEPKSKNVLDEWILARLNQLIETTTKNMDEYNIPKAVRPIEEFISDLSTWYVRRSRDRFKGDDKKDRESALETTGYVLLQLSKVMAPFMPFMAEQIWQKVTGNDFKDENKSVHLEAWIEAGKVDGKIIKEMEMIRKIVELGLAKRDEANIKVRQPLKELKVKSPSNSAGKQKLKVEDKYIDLIKDEVNVKAVIFEGNKEELKVELNTELTDELKQEGIKREIVRFINALRKQAKLTIKDSVQVYWQTKDENTQKAISENLEDIQKDTLAGEMKNEKSEDIDLEKEVNVNGAKVWLGIKKI